MCSQGDGTVFLLYLTMPPQGGFPHHPILQMWGLSLRGVKGLPRKEGCKWWDWNSNLGVCQPKGLGPLSLVLTPEMPTKVFLCFLSCCCHRNRDSPGPWEPVFTPSGHLFTHVRGKGYEAASWWCVRALKTQSHITLTQPGSPSSPPTTVFTSLSREPSSLWLFPKPPLSLASGK